VTLGDAFLIAFGVAGGISIGEVAKAVVAQILDHLNKRAVESHKFRLDLRKLDYVRVLDRYEACRTILAEVKADEDGIRGFVEQTEWDKMKAKVEEDDRYAPLFFLDESKSQLESILETRAHLLPASVIEPAITFRAAEASVDIITRAVMSPAFRTYETPRKLMLIARTREYSEEQLKLIPAFKSVLERTCDELAATLGLEKGGVSKI
jgi:hypothetical protein